MAIYFQNGSHVEVARIEGSPAYKSFMRKHDNTTSIVEDVHGISLLRNAACPPLQPLGLSICERDPDFESCQGLLRSLQSSVASYLGTTFCYAGVVVPDQTWQYQDYIINKAIKSVGLRLTHRVLSAAKLVMWANHINNPGTPHYQTQAVLSVDYSDSGLNVNLFADDEGVADVLRQVYDQQLGADRREEPGHLQAVKDLLTEATEAPLGHDLYGHPMPHKIQRVVFYGDAVMDGRFLDILKAVVGEDVVNNAHSFEPVFAAAVGTVLITGANGYLGLHVIDQALKRGYNVRGTVRSQKAADKVRATFPNDYGSRLTTISIEDLTKPELFHDAFDQTTIGVIHVASPVHGQVEDNVRDMLNPAIKGATGILEASKLYGGAALKRVVHVSSLAAMLDNSKDPHIGYVYDESDWNSTTFEEAASLKDRAALYLASKALSEKAVWAWMEDNQTNFDLSCLNPALVLGPHLEEIGNLDKITSTSKLLWQLMDAKEIPELQWAGVVDVRDTAAMLVAAVDTPAAGGQRFLLGHHFDWQTAADAARETLPEVKNRVPVGRPGTGGGPLAANLAREGHSVLLIEAGDDQADNINSYMVYNNTPAINVPLTRWDFFVTRDTPEIDNLYNFTTWNTTDGDFYVGLDPPSGSTRLGVYYPRAGVLGGCAMHNAATISLPADVDWQDVADLTGDETWSPANMRKYLVRLERCNYLVNGSTASHGFTGYLDTSQSDYSWALNESDVSTLAMHASTALGYPPEINATELAGLLGRDINSDDLERDNLLGVFTPHTHSRNGVRSSPSNYIRATVDDERKFPLTLQLNTLATKIIFDKPTNGNTAPRAIGVEYLQGQSLYSTDPRHDPSQIGVPGKAFASKEVIIAGGVFNTPQLLKLSGVGPADELSKFDIPLVKDIPGVGINMHDNLEGVIYGTFEKPVVGFWDMFMRTSVAERTRDIHFYCGSFNFIGFFPGMPGWAENEFECGFMQLHPRNINGTVKLRSTDPREAPNIHLGFFSQGDDADVDSMVEAINLASEKALDDILADA
ncbi:hypothetical protein K4K57_010480 [Colletotrichum sp. SAR 10_99]|nr:hypothetical protein K4K57_010480 [Colletotrichum sp. SAR 10_99]